jgi:sugar phosphate isomerase/epimerase
MTTRRSFLTQASLAAAGLLTIPALGASGAFRKKELPGLQLYSLRDQLPTDVRGGIAKVAQAGYKDVETFGLSKERTFWSLDPKMFKSLLQDNQLISTSGHYGMDEYLMHGTEDELGRYIKTIHDLDQHYLTIPSLGAALRRTGDDWKKVAGQFNALAARLKKEGIQLAYHNHNMEFAAVDNMTGYDLLLQNTDPSLVHFEMDLYWVIRGGADPVALFQRYPGRFPMWHIKDMDKARPELNTEVGNGSIDFKRIFVHARLAGLRQTFMEQENYAPGMNPYTSIGQSASYIKDNLL